jgi:NhaP-type Na+/H+ or K+/H+ antiporter
VNPIAIFAVAVIGAIAAGALLGWLHVHLTTSLSAQRAKQSNNE